MHFFKDKYSQDDSTNLEHQLIVLRNYPRFFNNYEGQEIGVEVDIKEVMRGFISICKGQNIWASQMGHGLFLDFFNLVGKELTKVVNECETKIGS